MKIAAIILCAGKSTRMKSERSKVLHEICGKPLCFWPIEHAQKMGADPLIVVVGHQAKIVQEALANKHNDSLSFALQSKQNGTGSAVQIAMKQLSKFSGSVLILCGDTPLLKQQSLEKICLLQQKNKANLALVSTEVENPFGYGRIVRDSAGKIQKIIEEAEANKTQKSICEINAGIYAFDANFLRDNLAKLEPSKVKGEIYLTDLVQLAAHEGEVASISITENEALGINDHIQLAHAEKTLQQEINKKWMSKGVTLVGPETTYISSESKISTDVVLEPGVHLKGKCKIAKNVKISVGCVLTDTTVEENACLHPYTICEQAFVGPNSQVGPFARLRPGATLEDTVKIGNFVEVKKSTFKKGAKANHLAYIGDAEIGEKSNVGAGTITCNYDGNKKHQTHLGKNVFIGSNSTLVAPINIEDGAYVAAGSTLTKNVPEHALALARTRQENKKDYAKKFKK